MIALVAIIGINVGFIVGALFAGRIKHPSEETQRRTHDLLGNQKISKR